MFFINIINQKAEFVNTDVYLKNRKIKRRYKMDRIFFDVLSIIFTKCIKRLFCVFYEHKAVTEKSSRKYNIMI